MPDPAVAVEGLSKRFGAVVAVENISFSIERGSICALLGANGAGKTTTLAMLLGLVTPTAGVIRVLGRDLRSDRYSVLARMNFSSPYVDLPQRLTVAENLDVYARLYGVRDIQARVTELGRHLDIEGLMRREYRTLSAGQKTRVVLAKALLNRPELVLLDEPTASLDPDSADRIRQYLVHYQRSNGATILLASHNMMEVERVCTQVLIMRSGEIVDRGKPMHLIAKYGRTTMEEVFLHIVRNGGSRGQAGTVQRAMIAVPEQVFSARRIGAMILRYLYLLRGSWPRILEQAYWPTVQMIMWGLVTQFFATNSSWVAQAAGVLIAAVLLWDVLFRAQLGVSVVFMEEMFARNLGQLFASPLRPYELVLALISISFVRACIGVGTAALLAIPLYQYSIFAMGMPLIAFFVNLLVFGWAIGLVICALLLRFGLGVESLAWASIFAIAPISGIYYPIATLPAWLQPVAWCLPSSHVFEGMRTVMFDQRFDVDRFTAAAELNVLYIVLAAIVFLRAFEVARARGLLLQSGE